MNVDTQGHIEEHEESFAEMFEASLKERGGDGVLKEGEIVNGTVVAGHQGLRHRRHRLQVRRPDPDRTSSPTPDGAEIVKVGDVVEVLPRDAARTTTAWSSSPRRRPTCMRDLGRDLAPLARTTSWSKAPSSPASRAASPSTSASRRSCPARQVDIAPGPQPRQVHRQEAQVQDHQVQQEARQHRSLPPRARSSRSARSSSATTLENLKEGTILKGVVKNITDYGAFIDLGGIDGLLHITDMSWGRINHPSRDASTVGDEIEVKVLKFDRADGARLASASSRSQDDPWDDADEKFPVGTRVKGKVVSLTDYGAFVELEHGVEGLIHVSEMSWTKRVKHPSKVVERRRRGRSRRPRRRPRRTSASASA